MLEETSDLWNIGPESNARQGPELPLRLAHFFGLQPLDRANKKQDQLRLSLLQTSNKAWMAPLSRCRTALRPFAFRRNSIDQLPKRFERPRVSAKAVSGRTMGLLRGVIDSVSAKLAFFPPVPPSYEVSQCLWFVFV